MGEKKEEKAKETEADEKKPGILDKVKSIGSHVQLPSFLSKKESKVKDVEAGGDAPAEGKEGEDEKENKDETKEEKEETKEEKEENKEEKDEEKTEKEEPTEEKKEEKAKETEAEEKKPGILDKVKSIGSHVQLPSFLSKKESKVKD